MTVDWLAVGALGVGVLIGFFLCLAVAGLFVKRRPMDGALRFDDPEVEAIISDLNKRWSDLD